MAGTILVSTAYLPPIEYFSFLSGAEKVLIEKEENYIKQTYRNRCYILTSNGPLLLSVPVLMGSFHKTSLKEIKIDYSKRWQQVHLRAMIASYRSSPFFDFYFDDIHRIISSSPPFLIDLNLELIFYILSILKLDIEISYTLNFIPITGDSNDYRYKLFPKQPYRKQQKEYAQVFKSENGFVTGLSIADLIFNMGPDSVKYL
jgi:hypothetical protein